MSYLFPKRVLRAGDILNPLELTEDISPAADRVSGRLNAHNFDQSIDTGLTVDYRAFYAMTHFKEVVPFGWTGAAAGAWGNPDGSEPAGYNFMLIQNNFEWQPIQGDLGVSVQRSITTGTSVLWINAYIQYLWWGFDWSHISGSPLRTKQHYNNAMIYPVNLQFALRVNGVLIPETITGVDDITYRASIPIKPSFQISLTGDPTVPGPADLRGNQVCALGPPCLPVRLGACVPVQPGDQLVEVVVRRVPYVTDRGIKLNGALDKVYLYNQQLNVIDLKMFPIDSVAAAETTADAFQEEELLTQASMYTDRVQPVIGAYNAVQEGALQRGALMNAQLPDALLDCSTTERDYGDGPTFNNWFPGHTGAAKDTVTTTGYAGAPATGWKLITDFGNTNPVKIQNLTISEPCRILVLVNLQVRNIIGPTVNFVTEGDFDGSASEFGSFALFKIMWQYASAGGTSWTGIEESLGMVNNFVWWPCRPTGYGVPGSVVWNPTPSFGLEHVEVALMAVIDFYGAAPTEPINIGVFGSVADDGTEYQVRCGNIIAMAHRYF